MLQLAQLVLLSVFLIPFAASAQIGARSSTPNPGSPNDPIPGPGLTRGPFGNQTLTLIKDPIYGIRNVSYFVVGDLAIIDGDVIYGTVNQLRLHDVTLNPYLLNDNSQVTKESRSLSVFSSNAAALWPSATVTYRYESDATATTLIPIVDAAIARWRSSAPWLTFNRLFPNSNDEANGVTTIRATECQGCYSHIGFDANAPRIINLQQACPKNPGWCGVDEATHEFGHLLGLYHEHQRPDRENTVRYQCQNVDPACPDGVSMPAGKTCCDTGLPKDCCSMIGNFAITAADSSGPYDIDSIMQYPSNSFAIRGTNTLVAAAPGVIIPASNPANPSTRDFDRICKLYQGQCPKAISCKAAGCPARCSVTKQCIKPLLCFSDDPPPCCDTNDINERCLAQGIKCSNMCCDFLF